MMQFKYLTIGCLLLAMTTSLKALAAAESYAEKPSWPKDSWHIDYVYDDFSDAIDHANLIYIPADYSTQTAFLLRCQPYYTNVNVAFLANAKQIKENGEFHNDSQKFAKHGFVYDEKRQLSVKVGDASFQQDVSLGGQKRGLSKWLKPLNQSLPAGQLQMSLFSTLVYDNIPEFTSNRNTDLSRDLYQAISTGLSSNQTIQMYLDLPNSQTREFELDLKRLKAFAPTEVIEFCFTARKLRAD